MTEAERDRVARALGALRLTQRRSLLTNAFVSDDTYYAWSRDRTPRRPPTSAARQSSTQPRSSSRSKGLHGASTDDIARAAGISQPYLFRLFGTKKELYLATAERAVDDLDDVFADAAAGKTGEEALHAMGAGLRDDDRPTADRLMLMLKCWASCDDPEICEVVRSAWRDLVDLAERASGESPEAVSTFFAKGMLLTILHGDGRVRRGRSRGRTGSSRAARRG